MALAALATDTQQLFVSAVGLGEPWATSRVAPLAHSYCQRVARSQAPVLIEDTRAEEAEEGQSYAGFPLRSADGRILGSFCAIDLRPHHWSAHDLAILTDLASAAESEIALLLANQELRNASQRDIESRRSRTNASERERGMWAAAQRDIAQVLSDAESVQGGISEALRVVCAAMDWAGGEYWQAGPDAQVLNRLTSWWSPALAGSELTESGDLTFARSQGVPGDVWSSGSPIWIPDLEADPGTFSRFHAARAMGMRAVIALPVLAGDHPGVMLFVCDHVTEPDDERLARLEAICAHAGQFLERRRAEELQSGLAQAQQDFDRMMSHVSDHVWTIQVHPDGRIESIFSSANAEGLFGGSPPTEAHRGAALRTLIHPDDTAQYEAFHESITSGQAAEIECRVVGFDGITRWVWTRAGIRHEDGRVLVDGISTNVTPRKTNEIALDEERRRLRQAQATGRLGSWEWDLTTDMVTWSETLFELYGVDPGKYTANEVNHDSIHPDDVDALGAAFRACAETGDPLLVRYRIVRKSDGDMRVFEARAERLEPGDGQPRRLTGTAMDITDRVRAEGEAISREAMLRAIIANSQSLIYVKDLNGRYLLANEPFQRAFSVTETDLLGQDDTYLDPVLAPVWRVNDLKAQEGQHTIEEWSDAADGRHYYDSVKFPLFDGEARLYAICGISLDVTAQRQAHQAMRAATEAAESANRAKSSFLATMSHEIRTPMNAVIGMTDLLQVTRLDQRQLEYIDTIRTSGDALLAVINDILDFSRIEAGEMGLDNQPFDLRRCVEDALSLVAVTATGLDLVADIDIACPRLVRGDANRLRQILVNLAGNAAKFTEHGDVLISVSPPPLVNPALTPQSEKFATEANLVFTVRDTGIGIPADRLHRLFKSFSQVDASTTRVYGGTGLGLAISQALVHQMGGDITVTSTVGVGSTFSFALTLELPPDDPEYPDQRFGAAGETQLAGRHVLIVDDNSTNRRILRIQAEQWSMTCTDVATPAEALALLAGGAAFDIAILDMNMPDLDGAHLGEQIRAQPAHRNLPLILLTSLDSTPLSMTDNLFAGIHTKPIRATALRSMLARVLGPPAALVPPSTPDEATPIAAPALRILLAEDNLVNQAVAKGMLHNLGHIVDVAANGREAVEILQDHDYDVVLMDIHMPTMDGLEATRTIRAQLPTQRQPYIVALTASALPEDRRACTLAGMNAYLLKPVRAAELGAMLLAVPRTATIAGRPDGASKDGTAVDLSALAQISADIGAHSPEVVRTLIEVYLMQGDEWIADLATAAYDGNTERVGQIAHTLGSSSTLLGAQTLADYLTEAARIARSAPLNQHDLTTAAARAAAEYIRVATVLRAESVSPTIATSADIG